MKKLILILIGILAGGALYIWVTPGMNEKLQDQVRDIATPDTTTVYKWQDQDGVWQISNSPPPGDIPYETEEYNEQANVIPSAKPKPAKR